MQQPEKMVLVVNDCPLLADCGEFDFVRATVPIQFQVFEWLLVSNKPDTFAFEWDNRIGEGSSNGRNFDSIHGDEFFLRSILFVSGEIQFLMKIRKV